MTTTAIPRRAPQAGEGPRRAVGSRIPHAERLVELAGVAVLFSVVLALAFATVVFGDRTFAPNGLLATQSGKRGADYPYKLPSRAAVNDAGAFAWFFEPTSEVVHDAYADGAVPLWNPHAGLGMPLAANFQSAPAGPFALPVHVSPTQGTWDLVFLLRLLVGGLGCFALLRALGAGRPAALVAATGYLLSSAFVLWLSSASLSVEALVPWLLLAVLALVRRSSAGRFAAVALLTAAMALGGQPESLVLAAYLAAAWAAYWWLVEGRRLRALADLAGAVLAGAMLASPFLLLSAEYVSLAYDSHGGRLGDARLAADVLPEALLGDFAKQRQAAVGIGLLALAAAGIAGRRAARVAGGGVLLAIAGVWGVRVLGLPGERVVGLLPGIDAVNVRRYGFFVAVLAAAVLAAAGVQAILRGSRAALAALAAVGVGGPVLAWLGGVPSTVARPAFLVGLALVVAGGVAGATRRAVVAPVLAAVLVAQFVLLTPRVYAREHDPFRPQAFVSYVQGNLAPGERATALRWIMRPQYPSAFGISDPRSLDALFPRRYARYVRQIAGTQEDGGWPARSFTTAGAASPLLDALGVRYVVTVRRRSLKPGFEPVFLTRQEGETLLVWRNREAFPRAWSPARIVAVPDARRAEAELALQAERLRTVAIVEDPTEAMLAADGTASVAVDEVGWNELRLRVNARGTALVVVSDQVYPGWEATVDGEPTPIRPANLAMRAVVVPDGAHTLVFRYRPRPFTVGLVLAALGLVLLGARALLPRLVARRTRAL